MFTPEQQEILVTKFAARVRQFRNSREMSQEALAEHIGCSVRQLQDIEHGVTTTSFLFLFAVLASMKDETMWNFLCTCIPEVRQVLNIQPLRLEATRLGNERPLPNGNSTAGPRIYSPAN
jgi:transcriptional regulator with XRE-family HTH domain